MPSVNFAGLEEVASEDSTSRRRILVGCTGGKLSPEVTDQRLPDLNGQVDDLDCYY